MSADSISKDRKADIRRASKEAKPPMGVYRIAISGGDAVSGSDKVFVDFAVDLAARFNRHKFELKMGSHRNKELQAAWNAHGEAAFAFEVLDELERDDDAREGPDQGLRVLAEMWLGKLREAGSDVAALFDGSP